MCTPLRRTRRENTTYHSQAEARRAVACSRVLVASDLCTEATLRCHGMPRARLDLVHHAGTDVATPVHSGVAGYFDSPDVGWWGAMEQLETGWDGQRLVWVALLLPVREHLS